MQREWTFQVSNAGNLPGQVRREFDDLVRGLAAKKLTLKLSEYRKKRSNPQLRYMFGVVVKMIGDALRELGNSVDDEDVYLFLKSHVWKTKQVVVMPDGEIAYVLGSNRDWSTQETEVKLEQARAWAAEVLGIDIPEPNEVPIEAYEDNK